LGPRGERGLKVSAESKRDEIPSGKETNGIDSTAKKGRCCGCFKKRH